MFCKCQRRTERFLKGTVDAPPRVRHDAEMLTPPQHLRDLHLEKPVDKDYVTQGLITQFQQMLRDGTLSQGDRLPPERELAAHFKVARSSLRQALKVLEILGIITQRVGDGSYLNSNVAAILSVPLEFLFVLDDTTVEDLIELRLLMEPSLARLAAQRANADDLELLQKSIQDLERSSDDKLKLVSSDLLFHRAIFSASKNRIAGSMFQNVHKAMAKMMLVTSQLVDLEHTLAFHKPIMRAIERRQGNLAAKLMKEHLEDAQRLLVERKSCEEYRKVAVKGSTAPTVVTTRQPRVVRAKGK